MTDDTKKLLETQARRIDQLEEIAAGMEEQLHQAQATVERLSRENQAKDNELDHLRDLLNALGADLKHWLKVPEGDAAAALWRETLLKTVVVQIDPQRLQGDPNLPAGGTPEQVMQVAATLAQNLFPKAPRV